MTEESISDTLDKLNAFFGRSKPQERGVYLSLGSVIGFGAIIVSVFVAIIGISIGYVSASRVHDLQREIDALKNRVDIAEAYINNLNQRTK